MSLDSTLARISQIETALAPPSSATLTGGTAAPASDAATSTSGSSSNSFAGALAQAMNPTSADPTATAATLPTSTAALPTSTTALPTSSTALPASTATLPISTATTTLPATSVTQAAATTIPATSAIGATSAVTAQPAAALSGAGNPAMVAIAQSQIGQAEEPLGSNESPAIETYKTATAGAVPGDGAPWCAYFASWVANEAGTPVGAQGQGSGAVSQIWSWAQQTGRAIPNGPGVVPQPGDLICFGDEHVGIVESVLPNGNIETIEGNYNNQVSQNVRSPTEATGYVNMS